MQVVIDIDENLYTRLFDNGVEFNTDDQYDLERSVRHGKVLPKGHGALKDVDKIGLTNFECLLCNGDYKEALKMLIDKIENADTIIEADKEVEG